MLCNFNTKRQVGYVGKTKRLDIIFFLIKKAKLNAYADDHQVYYSHVDPAALDACVSHDVGMANQWYHENGC